MKDYEKIYDAELRELRDERTRYLLGPADKIFDAEQKKLKQQRTKYLEEERKKN